MVNTVIFGKCFRKVFAGVLANRILSFTTEIVLFIAILLFPGGCSKKSSQPNNPMDTNIPPGSSKTCASITQGELLYDYGYVQPNEKHEVHFTIQNPTKDNIQIQRVRSECKCMYASNPPQMIPPDGDASITLVFVSPKKPQYYDKKLIIQTTSRLYPLLALRIKADVDRPLVCRPETTNLGTLERKEDRETSVTIFNRGNSTVRPIYATSSVDGFVAQIPRAEIPPGGELIIPLKIHLEGEAQENGTALVTIQTDVSSQPQISARFQYSLTNHSK